VDNLMLQQSLELFYFPHSLDRLLLL
jgi:hypothetical protein